MSHVKCVPISYRPKADAVFSGKCRQTIRRGTKYRVGDRLLLYEWTGKPRRSKWGRRLRVRVVEIHYCEVSEHGLAWEYPKGQIVRCLWRAPVPTTLAAADGIDPPTGEALRDTLKRLHGPNWQGVYQVIRWEVDS